MYTYILLINCWRRLVYWLAYAGPLPASIWPGRRRKWLPAIPRCGLVTRGSLQLATCNWGGICPHIFHIHTSHAAHITCLIAIDDPHKHCNLDRVLSKSISSWRSPRSPAGQGLNRHTRCSSALAVTFMCGISSLRRRHTGCRRKRSQHKSFHSWPQGLQAVSSIAWLRYLLRRKNTTQWATHSRWKQNSQHGTQQIQELSKMMHEERHGLRHTRRTYNQRCMQEPQRLTPKMHARATGPQTHTTLTTLQRCVKEPLRSKHAPHNLPTHASHWDSDARRALHSQTQHIGLSSQEHKTEELISLGLKT